MMFQNYPQFYMTTLQTKTDNELVKLVKDDANSEAFKEVCRRYENIFYKICQKYVNPLTMSGVNPQDIFDEKSYILFHCVNTFKSNKKTKLGTWIGNYARYLCLNSINARRFIVPTTDDDLKRHLEDSQAKTNFLDGKIHAQEDFKYVLNLLNQLKDPRIIEIFRLRYFGAKRMIWTKIAKKMRISTQTAINLHNRGLDLLRRKLASENISDVI
jgi:RNA polymerase sigma factor (sigma-70 family)